MARATRVRRRLRRARRERSAAGKRSVLDFLTGLPAAAPEQQIAAAVSQTLTLAAAYRRLAEESLVPAWRWRCSFMAAALDDALEATFAVILRDDEVAS